MTVFRVSHELPAARSRRTTIPRGDLCGDNRQLPFFAVGLAHVFSLLCTGYCEDVNGNGRLTIGASQSMLFE